MSVFRLPDLGEGVQEAELVAWSVAVGDRVVADQPLVSVETDKAVVEIPSPQSGVIKAIHGRSGDVVKVGAPLVEFGAGAREDAGAVVGELSRPPSQPPPARRPPAASPASAAPSPIVRASPAARKLAAELGVDLGAIRGEGPDGGVTLAQVRAAREGSAKPAGAPLAGPRRAMAAAMTRARDAVSPATLTDDADISRWPKSADATTRLVQALTAACAAEPGLNAWFDDEAMTLLRSAEIDVAIAVDTPDGLFAPVLRHAQTLSAAKICKGVSTLVASVRAREIDRDGMRGATITLSNFGTLGGRYAQLVVSPPQVAILGAGRIKQRPVVRGGELATARLLPLSLTFDHRVVTGGEAARFMAAVKADLERGGRKG